MRFKSRGIVLTRMPLREADLMVSILTADHGQVKAIARGAQRSVKRFLGGIDLFDCATFEFSVPQKGKSSLNTLETLSEREVWIGLRQSLTPCALGMLCLEITHRFLPEDDVEGRQMYAPLHDTLSHLNAAANKKTMLLIVVLYLLVILDYGGYSLLENRRDDAESPLSYFDRDGLALFRGAGGPFAIFDPIVLSALLADLKSEGEEEKTKQLRDDLLLLLDAVEHTLGQPLKTRAGVLAQIG